jgi:lysophospholipase L1-like esterase
VRLPRPTEPTKLSSENLAAGRGQGVAVDVGSLLWRNRDDDFPAWAGRDLTARNPTARLALLASDGATSTTVAGEQLGRLRRLELRLTLATVTMGGNDLLAAYGDATAARRAIRTVVDNGRLVLGTLRSLMGRRGRSWTPPSMTQATAAGMPVGLACHPGQRRWSSWPNSIE